MDSFLFGMEWVLPLRSDWATPVAQGFTWMGYTPFFLIFLPLGYWLWDRAVFTRLAALIAITALINGWFKDLWLDPRPGADIQLDGRVTGSPGRPSGHTQVAVAMWLWLAYEINRPLAWVVCSILALGVSFSRLYLGVHDVDDVLTGAAFGMATLAVFAWAVRPDNTHTQALRNSLPAQLALIAILVPMVWAIWPPLPETVTAVVRSGPGPVTSVLFLLLGWLIGAALDRVQGGDAAPPRVMWHMATIAIVGIVVLFALRAGVEETMAILGAGPTLTGYVTAFVLGVYMTGLAPMAFRAVGLMPTAQHSLNERLVASSDK